VLPVAAGNRPGRRHAGRGDALTPPKHGLAQPVLGLLDACCSGGGLCSNVRRHRRSAHRRRGGALRRLRSLLACKEERPHNRNESPANVAHYSNPFFSSPSIVSSKRCVGSMRYWSIEIFMALTF